MIKEFKEFIQRGNVLDLAVGVVMGNAFGKIVSSVVNDILMPIVGIFLGGINFQGLSFKIGNAVINYGSFIQNVIDFLIIALCIFLMIKVINKIIKKEPPKEKAPELSDETKVLMEIKELLAIEKDVEKNSDKKEEK